jgi:type I restriction-modification system DNA methylase subunit
MSFSHENIKQRLIEKLQILQLDIRNDVYSIDVMNYIFNEIPYSFDASITREEVQPTNREVIKYLFRGWYMTKMIDS